MTSRDPNLPESDSAAILANLQQRVDTLERQVALLRQPTASPAAFQTPETSSAPPPMPFVPAPPRQSLENRLGSQVFSNIGIVALLAGTAWFLKWAIDNQWIGPTSRVLIGLVAGIALVLWSERSRRKGLPAFSYAVKAVGSGVLYLSLWAAYQLYNLLPANVALAAMLAVTAWNAWMAWAQDAELLAGYALLGAFATPYLLSTGGNHEIFLFTYIAAVDLATILLVRFKPWPRLLVPTFVGTVAFFIGWYVQHFQTTPTSARDQLVPTLIYLTLFLAIFAAATAARDVSGPPQSSPIQRLIAPVLLPLANAVFISLALYSVLEDSGNHTWLPWAALLLAAVYLGLTQLQRSPTARAAHLSLAIILLTLAIPLKATGRWIAIGWLMEGAVLLWTAWQLAARDPDPDSALAFRFFRALACLALALGFIDLVTLPLRGFGPIPSAFLNARFATALVGIAAFALSAAIARRASPQVTDPFWRNTALIATLALNLTGLQAGVNEIITYWRSTGQALASNLSISAFLMIYGATLLAAGFWRRSAPLRWQALLLLVCTIAKVFLYDISGLSQGYRVASFLGLGALLLGVSLAYQKNLLGLRPDIPPPSQEEAHP